jgi:hypothetical protein
LYTYVGKSRIDAAKAFRNDALVFLDRDQTEGFAIVAAFILQRTDFSCERGGLGLKEADGRTACCAEFILDELQVFSGKAIGELQGHLGRAVGDADREKLAAAFAFDGDRAGENAIEELRRRHVTGFQIRLLGREHGFGRKALGQFLPKAATGHHREVIAEVTFLPLHVCGLGHAFTDAENFTERALCHQAGDRSVFRHAAKCQPAEAAHDCCGGEEPGPPASPKLRKYEGDEWSQIGEAELVARLGRTGGDSLDDQRRVCAVGGMGAIEAAIGAAIVRIETRGGKVRIVGRVHFCTGAAVAGVSSVFRKHARERTRRRRQ